MKTPDEINMNAENAFVLREAAKAHDMGYSDHLAHGGKGDPAEERWIEALNAGADALSCIQQLETKCHRLERERDAAVDDIRSLARCCKFCKHDAFLDCKSTPKLDHSCFEWRGVKEE